MPVAEKANQSRGADFLTADFRQSALIFSGRSCNDFYQRRSAQISGSLHGASNGDNQKLKWKTSCRPFPVAEQIM
jgi:hypothetical protein